METGSYPEGYFPTITNRSPGNYIHSDILDRRFYLHTFNEWSQHYPRIPEACKIWDWCYIGPSVVDDFYWELYIVRLDGADNGVDLDSHLLCNRIHNVVDFVLTEVM